LVFEPLAGSQDESDIDLVLRALNRSNP
jgi:hypothetical protein